MKCLIVCATAAEFPFPDAVDQASAGCIPQEVMGGRYPGIQVFLLVTGPGMVPMAYHLSKALLTGSYDLVLNLGIAGCFHPGVPLGTVFQVTEDCFAWWGAEDGEDFLSVFNLGLVSPDDFPFQQRKLLNNPVLNGTVLPAIPVAKAITVTCGHGREAGIESTRKYFPADLESMEGAAFFYVCLMEKVKCLQLRAVSNLVEKRNKKAWDIARAVDSLKRVTGQILEEFSSGKVILD